MNDMLDFAPQPLVNQSFDSIRAAMTKAIANLTDQEMRHRERGQSAEADRLWDWIKHLLRLSVEIERAHSRYLASQSSQPQIAALVQLTAQARAAVAQFQAIADILNRIAAVIEIFTRIGALKL